MIREFLNWMLYYSTGFLLFPITIAGFRVKFMTRELRYIIAFLGLSVLTQVIATILNELNGNNLSVLHVYTILEFNLIALFYFSFFGHFYHRRLVPVLMMIFSAFAVFNSLFIQKVTSFNTYARGLEAIGVIALSLLCFYKMLVELEAKRPEKQPVFWINTGFLFYFAGSLILFILSNLILKENKTFNYLSWGLHSVFLALLYIFIGIGLWYSPHQK